MADNRNICTESSLGKPIKKKLYMKSKGKKNEGKKGTIIFICQIY